MRLELLFRFFSLCETLFYSFAVFGLVTYLAIHSTMTFGVVGFRVVYLFCG